MASTLRVLSATQEHWVKKLHDETVEQHPFLSLLRSKGRIVKVDGGEKNKWTVKYKQLDLSGYGDMEQLTWARNNLHKTAELEWRGYKMTDAISEKEMRENAGQAAVIKLFTNKLESMRMDANDQFNAELYVDGNLAGNEKRYHGVESFMGITPGSQTAGDKFATVYNDSYAGLSTVLANYGGSSTSDPEYDFWSPVVVSTNRTGETWAADADEQIRRGILYTHRGRAANERLDLILLSRAGYEDLVELLEGKERLVFNRGSDVGVGKFGFSAIQIDGVDVMIDPDIPTTDANSDTVYGYGFTSAWTKLCLLGGKGSGLWNASGSVFSELDMSFRFWVGTWGNLQFSPRHTVKFADIA